VAQSITYRTVSTFWQGAVQSAIADLVHMYLNIFSVPYANRLKRTATWQYVRFYCFIVNVIRRM